MLLVSLEAQLSVEALRPKPWAGVFHAGVEAQQSKLFWAVCSMKVLLTQSAALTRFVSRFMARNGVMVPQCARLRFANLLSQHRRLSAKAGADWCGGSDSATRS